MAAVRSVTAAAISTARRLDARAATRSQTGFYDVDASRTDGMVILIALAAHHHHFIHHASCRAGAPFCRAEACQGGGAKQESARRPR
jgi:hypothetical protein